MENQRLHYTQRHRRVTEDFLNLLCVSLRSLCVAPCCSPAIREEPEGYDS